MINSILKKKRKELGLTQKEAAEKIGISIYTYRAYEQGKRDLYRARFDIANKIYEVFNFGGIK